MKARSFSVVAATCLAGTEATMKVRSLSVVAATCMVGAEAATIGARDPSLGSWLNTLFGGGPGGGGPAAPPAPGGPPAPPASAPSGPGNTDGKPFDFNGFNKALGNIAGELKDAANPARPPLFGLPDIAIPLSPSKLAADLNDVQDAINSAQKFLSASTNAQIPPANQAATCALVTQVLNAETALLTKININLANPASSLSKAGYLPSVGKTLGQSSKSINDLVTAIAVVAPLCQANASEGQSGVSAIFQSLINTARDVPSAFAKGLIKDLLELINIIGGQQPNLPPTPPASSSSIPPVSLPSPSTSIPPVSMPSVITLPTTQSFITLPTTSLPISAPASTSTSIPPASFPSVITLSTTQSFITLPTTSTSILESTMSSSSFLSASATVSSVA